MNKYDEDIRMLFAYEISNDPVEAINGRLKHPRGTALGFKGVKLYILRSLLHAGQLQGWLDAL